MIIILVLISMGDILICSWSLPQFAGLTGPGIAIVAALGVVGMIAIATEVQNEPSDLVEGAMRRDGDEWKSTKAVNGF